RASGSSPSTPGSQRDDAGRSRPRGRALRRGCPRARPRFAPLHSRRGSLSRRQHSERHCTRVGRTGTRSRSRSSSRRAGEAAQNKGATRLTDVETSLPVAERPRRPEWMKVRAPSADSKYFDVKKLIHGASLHTICEEARCPNIAECWGRGTATFQILGDTCTRACRYCYVHSAT